MRKKHADVAIREPYEIVLFPECLKRLAELPESFGLKGEGIVSEIDILRLGMLLEAAFQLAHHVFDAAQANGLAVAALIAERAMKRTATPGQRGQGDTRPAEDHVGVAGRWAFVHIGQWV